MEHKLEWLSEEEGRIAFFENSSPFLTVEFFLTGEDEAEFKIQDIVLKCSYIRKRQNFCRGKRCYP